jgi:hypothetical protein
MTEPGQVTVTLTFTPLVAARLAAVAEPGAEYRDQAHKISTVLYELADHAQQAVYRPGSWEREWILQAFGYAWLGNLEPDPEHADIGWQRPRSGGATP